MTQKYHIFNDLTIGKNNEKVKTNMLILAAEEFYRTLNKSKIFNTLRVIQF